MNRIIMYEKALNNIGVNAEPVRGIVLLFVNITCTRNFNCTLHGAITKASCVAYSL